MKWIKKGSKTVLNEFIGSVKAKIITDPTKYDGGKALWLRRDVDYDLDHAIKFAEYEYRNNIRATYFLLHTAPYFDYSKEFKEKILLLDDMGHSIGFHNDILSCWHKNQEMGLNDFIPKPIKFLRKAAPPVNGTSCHGAKEHYDRKYFNYECWEEFDKKKNEGFDAICGFKPSLERYGFEYEAYFLPYTHYFSDSGNNWIGYVVNGQKPFERTALESPDNLGTKVIDKFNEAEEGLFQMLLHPCHWEEVL